jgi:hypothetical protein
MATRGKLRDVTVPRDTARDMSSVSTYETVSAG